MKGSLEYYRVGLILSDNLTISDYELSVGNQNYKICFYNNITCTDKYCDLIITDKEPNNLSSIPAQQKYCHGTTLVINNISNPLKEQQYEAIFTKTTFLKYKSLKKISKESITKSINSELIKHQVKDNKFDAILLFFNKNTRGELFSRIFEISWLLVPFILIILYLVAKYSLSKFGYSLSFLCWFIDYGPNCKNNLLRELKLLALIYSVFNFNFYYNYILSIYANINNDVFQFNTGTRFFHKALQFITPLILFVSVLLIFKELFVFKYSFRIAAENGFINIGLILDRLLPFLKDYLLIYYFLLLDGCLWFMTKNFSKTIATVEIYFSSNRQKNLIKEAKKSFGTSMAWDIVILISTYALFRTLIPDPQSKLAVQLILLQSVYLYINLSIILNDFKYR